MQTTWKFPLEVRNKVSIEMPALSEILTVQTQGGTSCIWAKVFTDSPMVTRDFEIVGTGHEMWPIKKRREYVGTYQLNDGALIFHLFELKD